MSTSAWTDEDAEDLLRRFVGYITADGFGVGSIVTRLERLQFEQIVQEKTCAEVLADLP